MDKFFVHCHCNMVITLFLWVLNLVNVPQCQCFGVPLLLRYRYKEMPQENDMISTLGFWNTKYQTLHLEASLKFSIISYFMLNRDYQTVVVYCQIIGHYGKPWDNVSRLFPFCACAPPQWPNTHHCTGSVHVITTPCNPQLYKQHW